MANKIRQYRFYNNKNGANKNYPSTISINNVTTDVTYDYYTNGTVFENNFPILQLGIQAPPGTKFKINNGDGDWIIIGTTGIFELDLEGKTEIIPWIMGMGTACTVLEPLELKKDIIKAYKDVLNNYK